MRTTLVFLSLVGTAASATAQVGFSDSQIDAVLAVLPESARDGAHVAYRTPQGLETIRDGSNEWRCWIERIGERMGGNCHHAGLEALIRRKRALADEPVPGEDPDETLAREVRSGQLSVPWAAMEITAYGPVGVDGVPTLPSRRFFLYFPFADATDVGVPDVESPAGGPWLHEAGTVNAHLMWSRPIEESGR